MFKEMENILLQMLKDDTGKLDEWMMNVILRVFGYRREIEIMEKWYKIFQNIGIQPDIKTFEILIGLYAKEHLYEEMVAIIKYMNNSFLSWTIKTYY